MFVAITVDVVNVLLGTGFLLYWISVLPYSLSQHCVYVFFHSTYHKIIYLFMYLFPICPLDRKLHEGREPVYFVHLYIFNTKYIACPTADIQIFVE